MSFKNRTLLSVPANELEASAEETFAFLLFNAIRVVLTSTKANGTCFTVSSVPSGHYEVLKSSIN